MMKIKYKGEEFNYINDFYGHKVLTATNPFQTNMEGIKHIGEMPNEYGYYLEDLSPKYVNLYYGDVQCGVIIKIDNVQTAYLINKYRIDCDLPDLDDEEMVDKDFWTIVPKNIVNAVDNWIKENY